MSNPIDDLINDYAMRAQEIYDNESGGPSAWRGLLLDFTEKLPDFDPYLLGAGVSDWAIRFDDVFRIRTAGAHTFVGMLAEFARSIDARVEVAR